MSELHAFMHVFSLVRPIWHKKTGLAACQEMDTLVANGTWELVTLPPGLDMCTVAYPHPRMIIRRVFRTSRPSSASAYVIYPRMITPADADETDAGTCGYLPKCVKNG